MRLSPANLLWGKHARSFLLVIATLALLLTSLGARELWTQEHRWADIVSHMFQTNDFLHPWLNGQPYYDKPLLSYWLISGTAILTGKLSTWALRLPSAVAGIIAIGAIVSLGKQLKNRELGLLAGWMLLTTFYFLFWARTSSADMLNMAGTLCAVSWYFEKKPVPRFLNYSIFYLIIAFTALCKGLIAPVVVVLVILPDLLKNGQWRKHLRPALFLAALPALILYLLPFWVSAKTGGTHYQENGLMLVWRENVLRYFQPFDHKGPIYTYFLYLPVYLLPWTLFFIPSLATFRKRLMSTSVLILFVFLTLSGSRRDYYILPVVPFALLMSADWILAEGVRSRRCQLAGWLALISATLFFLFFCILQPLYYKANSLEAFSIHLKQEAEKTRPWWQWKVVLLDPQSKLRFYLGLPADTALNEIQGKDRASLTEADLRHNWSFLTSEKPVQPTIYITREAWKVPLQHLLGSHYRIIENPPCHCRHSSASRPVAFIGDR